MAHVVRTIKLNKLDTLPGTSYCAADMDCDGAMVIVRDDGSLSVAVWVESSGSNRPSIRYSYQIDAQANYILGSARYSTKKLDDLLHDMALINQEKSSDVT